MGAGEAVRKDVSVLHWHRPAQRPETWVSAGGQAVAGATARTEEADKTLGVAPRAGCASVGFGMRGRAAEAWAVSGYAPPTKARPRARR